MSNNGLSIDQTGFECLNDPTQGITNQSGQLTFIKPQINQHRKRFMTSNKQQCHVNDRNILLLGISIQMHYYCDFIAYLIQGYRIMHTVTWLFLGYGFLTQT